MFVFSEAGERPRVSFIYARAPALKVEFEKSARASLRSYTLYPIYFNALADAWNILYNTRYNFEFYNVASEHGRTKREPLIFRKFYVASARTSRKRNIPIAIIPPTDWFQALSLTPGMRTREKP